MPTSAAVRYRGLYPRTDRVFHGRDGRLEYDFVLKPGADPRRIRLAFQGQGGLRQEPDGGLTVLAGGAELRQFRPEVYQETPGGGTPVPGRFRLLPGNQVGFQVGPYDPARPLVIDPSVARAVTGAGAQGDEWFSAVAVDAAGCAYATGLTRAPAFPAQALPGNPLGASSNPGSSGLPQVFAVKLSTDGSGLQYADLLAPGTSQPCLALDPLGAAYLAGSFYVGANPGPAPGVVAGASPAFHPTAFLAKLRLDGSQAEFAQPIPSATPLDPTANDLATCISGLAWPRRPPARGWPWWAG